MPARGEAHIGEEEPRTLEVGQQAELLQQRPSVGVGGHKPRVLEGAQGDEPALRLRCVATPDIGPELGDARKGRPSITVVHPRQAVWVSTTADVRWNAPPSDMISVEESVGEIQPWNDGNTASEIIRERFKKAVGTRG